MPYPNPRSTSSEFELVSEHIRLVLNPDAGSITGVQGRFDGCSEYSTNLLLSRGLRWDSTGNLQSEHRLDTDSSVYRLISLSQEGDRLDCELGWFPAGENDIPEFTVRWQLQLHGWGARIRSQLKISPQIELPKLSFEIELGQSFVVALFERGVVQQLTSGSKSFASTDDLYAFYTIKNSHGSIAIVPQSSPRQFVIQAKGDFGAVSLHMVDIGEVAVNDMWVDKSQTTCPPLPVTGPYVAEVCFDIYANDLAFPTHELSEDIFATEQDANTHYTALYASQVGSLGTYELAGSAYPTLAAPEREYGTLHTFFDPDAWSVVNSLSYSGQPYFQRQARDVLERALNGILESGQIPHHFDGELPVYVAISGASQTGPNIFWCLAALDYVCATGDSQWLQSVWSKGLLPATEWVFSHYDQNRHLLQVTGPLWVDVFRREGFTLDTNVMAVRFFDRVAQAARFLGHRDAYVKYAGVVAEIKQGLESLWNGEDHFVSSRSSDWGTLKDSVDAENYLAVAFGVTNEQQTKALLQKMDSIPNQHPGGKGTWVSEAYYGVDDCYGGNTGDSRCAMARLWWADLLSRQAVGDMAMFKQLYEPVRRDLLENTWMRERYDADGEMIRAIGYHEYPGILDMALREGYYGLEIGLYRIRLRPMRVGSFHFRLGQIVVNRSEHEIDIRVPGKGIREFQIEGLIPGTSYSTSVGLVAIADSAGAISFMGEAGVLHTMTTSVGLDLSAAGKQPDVR